MQIVSALLVGPLFGRGLNLWDMTEPAKVSGVSISAVAGIRRLHA
jgi:hypothetical protein